MTIAKCCLNGIFVVALFAGCVSGSAQSEILRERIVQADANHLNPLVIKGKSYYVTDRQMAMYVWGLYTFLVGVVGSIASMQYLEGAARRAKRQIPS
jgi:hypothetical protein